jgi:hypothetical protein
MRLRSTLKIMIPMRTGILGKRHDNTGWQVGRALLKGKLAEIFLAKGTPYVTSQD